MMPRNTQSSRTKQSNQPPSIAEQKALKKKADTQRGCLVLIGIIALFAVIGSVSSTKQGQITSTGTSDSASVQSKADVYYDALYFAQLSNPNAKVSDGAVTLMGSRILQIEARCPGVKSSDIRSWGDDALSRVAAKGQDPKPFNMLTDVLGKIINNPGNSCKSAFEAYP